MADMMDVDEADSDTAVVARPMQSVEEDEETTVKEEDVMDEGSDGDADDTVEAGTGGDDRPVSSDQYKTLKNITDTLTNYRIPMKGNEEYYPSTLFKRIPNRRLLPDYHQVIKEPSAISTLKGKIQRKQYSGIPEFVRDFALIVHNAQVYNRPNSAPVRDVLRLETLFKAEMKKMVEQGLAKEDEIEFPDLGPIPAATPEPDPVSENEEEGEDDAEDEDDEDEEGEESDDDGHRRRGRKSGRPSITGRKSLRDEDEDGGRSNDATTGKRRGRPPKVDTPLEARIKAVLKGIRRSKDEHGLARIRHFERLPDKAEYPHYYTEIKDPIALDIIKRKAKRKKYHSMDHFLKDMLLMLQNARTYNEDFSEIYTDADELEADVLRLVEEEMAKPDTEFVMEDGRLPLPDGILYKNEMWKVGDWIHLQNPNDVTKPIVAQIYRTWEDPEGQKWINACWYYRPEQTIHQFEKYFFPNEVVKTGQYRDHQIEEVIDRCFVMFFTRYNRGRPRNLNPSIEVYVCEARYNEEKHKFNKIKTWASCLPDEVRDKDYEMDLFDMPRKIRKLPSPIKHTLKDGASEGDGLPQPTWGHPNAPPVIGAVHKRPRDENQSPPPEPTPPPVPIPQVQPLRTPSMSNMNHHQQPQAPYERPPSSHNPPPTIARQSSNPAAQTPTPRNVAATNVQQFGQRQPYQPISAHPYAAPATPALQPAYHGQQAAHPQPGLAAAHPTSYTGATPQQAFPRPATNANQAPVYHTTYPANPAKLPLQYRDQDVFVLSDAANESIPKSIRDRYPQDDQGRVLWFTKPPMLPATMIEGRTEAEKGKPLQHTKEYLEAKARRMAAIGERKRQLIEKMARDKAAQDYQTAPHGYFSEERDPDGRIKADPVKAAQIQAEWAAKEVAEAAAKEAKAKEEAARDAPATAEQIEETKKLCHDYFIKYLEKECLDRTANEYLAKYGDRALEIFNEDIERTKEWNRKEDEKDRIRAERKAAAEAAEARSAARYGIRTVNGIDYKDFWTGLYLDDYDPRY